MTVLAQTAPGPTRGTASISGRVMVADRPAVNVEVVVRRAEPGIVGVLFPVIARTSTDSEGRFRFANLPAGSCSVAAIVPSYVDSRSQPGNEFKAYQAFVLDENDAIKDINFNLVRGAVITGRVVDSEGRPVIGEVVRAQLYAKAEGDTPGHSGTPVERLTDDRGVYRFYGLMAGNYVVSCGRGASPTSAIEMFTQKGAFYQRLYYPAAPTIDEATSIEVSAGGEAANIDIRVGKLQAGFRASGRVVNADGGTLTDGLYLSFEPVAEDGPSGAGGFTMVGEDGAFSFHGLVAGTYEIRVPRSSADELNFPITKIEIVDSDLENLVIKGERGLSVRGMVTVENTSSGPLPFRLSELNLNGSTTGEGDRPGSSGRAKINPDGSFSIGGLRPGRLQLSNYSYLFGVYPLGVERSGVPQPGVLDGSPSNGEGAAALMVSGESPINDLTVRFVYGNCQIRGTVSLADGELPAGARIDVSYRRTAGSDAGNAVSPDARGRFLAKGLIPGEYKFSAFIHSSNGNATWRGTATIMVRNDADNAVALILTPAGDDD